MKTGIVTLYNCYNYGAYLQALAMQRTLQRLGTQPEFLNIDTPKYHLTHYGMLAWHSVNTLEPAKALFNARRLRPFIDSWKELNVPRRAYVSDRRRYDAAVIGSDELWNVRNPSSYRAPQFFGNDIDAGRIVTYAVSCGEATYADLADRPGVRDGLSRVDALSGRDDNTCAVIERLTGRKAAKVVDPTLLADLSDMEQPHGELGRYILVYTYVFSREEIEATRAFARRRGLPLLSVGLYNSWCDRQLGVSPFVFLNLVRNAEYVITNSFHGTIFSALYRKNLGIFAADRPKVVDFLTEFGLAQRNLSRATSLDAAFEQEVDWAHVHRTIAHRRRQSLDFLTEALGLARTDAPLPEEAA